MPDSVSTNVKKELRRQLKTQWEKLKSNPTFWLTLQAQINQQCLKFLTSLPLGACRNKFWGAYVAMDDEVSLQGLLDHKDSVKGNLQAEWKWAFPRIQDLGGMDFWQPQDPSNESNWECHSWGLQQPRIEQSQRVLATEMAGVFVPGLGFDQRGYRLGRGKGFYDRYFQTEGAEIPYKVGICPEGCLLESVDGTWMDSWDQKLQWVITEKRIIDCRKK